MIQRFSVTLQADARGHVPPVRLPVFDGYLLAIVKSGPACALELLDATDTYFDYCSGLLADLPDGSVSRVIAEDVAMAMHPTIERADAINVTVSGNTVPDAQFVVDVLVGSDETEATEDEAQRGLEKTIAPR